MSADPEDRGPTAPGAAPLPAPGQQEAPGQTCFVVLDKVQPGKPDSDVLASGCRPSEDTSAPAVATVPGAPATSGPTRFRRDAAPNAAPSSAVSAAPGAAASSAIPIMELYADANYGGKSFIIYGYQGPCDGGSGYAISDTTNQNSTVGGISSYHGYNGCTSAKIYNQTDLAGTPASFYSADVPSLPAGYDNKVYSARERAACTTYSQTGKSVCGVIRDKYETLGGPTGPLGYPTSNETTNPDNVGKRNTFQNQNASIYWSPSTGANEIQGQIFNKWGQLGYEAGLLGYPTSDELATSDTTGRKNTFAKTGAIYFSPPTGAHQVSGPIYQNWTQWGSEKSPVGYPLSDEVDNTKGRYAQKGSRRNDFQMGQIYNNNGTVTRGVWMAYNGSSTVPMSTAHFTGTSSRAEGIDSSTVLPRAAARPSLFPSVTATGCPDGTDNYPPPKQIYNCLVVINDTTKYDAGIRAGFSAHNGNPNPPQDDNSSTKQPFGSAHALDDHNVSFHNQQLIIQDAAPYRDGNAPNYLRYLYTVSFVDENGVRDSANVVVQKQPDNDIDGAPDEADFGLITGYCNKGVPNAMNYQGFCSNDLAPPFGSGPGGVPG